MKMSACYLHMTVIQMPSALTLWEAGPVPVALATAGPGKHALVHIGVILTNVETLANIRKLITFVINLIPFFSSRQKNYLD